MVDQAGRSAVDGEGIGGLNFETAEAAVAHDVHFTFEFGLGDGGTEPPPADHWASVGWGLIEGAAELVDVGLGDRLCEGGAAGCDEEEDCAKTPRGPRAPREMQNVESRMQNDDKRRGSGAGGWCHGSRLAGGSARG